MPDARFAELEALLGGSVQQRREAGHIMAATAAAFGMTVDDLKRRTNKYEYSHPRHVACYLIRKYCCDRSGRPLSYPMIGRLFGGLHHTTIIHGCRKMRRLASKEAGTITEIMQREETMSIIDVRKQINEVRRQIDMLADTVERYARERQARRSEAA